MGSLDIESDITTITNEGDGAGRSCVDRRPRTTRDVSAGVSAAVPEDVDADVLR